MPQVYVNIVLFLMENSPWMLFGWKLSRLLTFNHLSIECFDLTLSFACLPFTVIDFRGISFLSFYLYLLSSTYAFFLPIPTFFLPIPTFFQPMLFLPIPTFFQPMPSFYLHLLSFYLHFLSNYFLQPIPTFFLPIPTFLLTIPTFLLYLCSLYLYLCSFYLYLLCFYLHFFLHVPMFFLPYLLSYYTFCRSLHFGTKSNRRWLQSIGMIVVKSKICKQVVKWKCINK